MFVCAKDNCFLYNQLMRKLFILSHVQKFLNEGELVELIFNSNYNVYAHFNHL